MNEDGSAMIHEARRPGLLQVTALIRLSYKRAFILNNRLLKASKVRSLAANETSNIIYIYVSSDTK